MKQRKYRGFTLAELMVCMALIAIIATLLMPAITRVRPNKKLTMFKKAYMLTERIVSEMINDDTLYPEVELLHGFDNTVAVTINNNTYGSNDSSNEDAINSKFCRLFASQLNTLESETTIAERCTLNKEIIRGFETRYGLVTDADEDDVELDPATFEWTFTTTDGIAWALPATDFEWALPYDDCAAGTTSTGDAPCCDIDTPGNPCYMLENPYQRMYIDVNGTNEGPGCLDGTPNCPDPDIFAFRIRTDGLIKILPEENAPKANEYMRTSNMIQGR